MTAKDRKAIRRRREALVASYMKPGPSRDLVKLLTDRLEKKLAEREKAGVAG